MSVLSASDEWKPNYSVPVATTESERFRLADPFLCLVCGGESGGVHWCGQCQTMEPEAVKVVFESRFRWTPSQLYLNQVAAESSEYMGVKAAWWLDNYAPLLTEKCNYSEFAKEFFRAFSMFLSDRPSEHGKDRCFSVESMAASSLSGDIGPEQSSRVECALCRFDLARFLLSTQEDKRHGLNLGDTEAEWRRLGVERSVVRKQRDIADLDLSQIVENSMRGDDD